MVETIDTPIESVTIFEAFKVVTVNAALNYLGNEVNLDHLIGEIDAYKRSSTSQRINKQEIFLDRVRENIRPGLEVQLLRQSNDLRGLAFIDQGYKVEEPDYLREMVTRGRNSGAFEQTRISGVDVQVDEPSYSPQRWVEVDDKRITLHDMQVSVETEMFRGESGTTIQVKRKSFPQKLFPFFYDTLTINHWPINPHDSGVNLEFTNFQEPGVVIYRGEVELDEFRFYVKLEYNSAGQIKSVNFENGKSIGINELEKTDLPLGWQVNMDEQEVQITFTGEAGGSRTFPKKLDLQSIKNALVGHLQQEFPMIISAVNNSSRS